MFYPDLLPPPAWLPPTNHTQPVLKRLPRLGQPKIKRILEMAACFLFVTSVACLLCCWTSCLFRADGTIPAARPRAHVGYWTKKLRWPRGGKQLGYVWEMAAEIVKGSCGLTVGYFYLIHNQVISYCDFLVCLICLLPINVSKYFSCLIRIISSLVINVTRRV